VDVVLTPEAPGHGVEIALWGPDIEPVVGENEGVDRFSVLEPLDEPSAFDGAVLTIEIRL
jgi:hypothetical protein